ncbi:MAG: Gfo/Idh/MocA family oxidoreductase [Verrucomicrobiota bacterium]
MSEPVTLAIVGAGKRGQAYAAYATAHPEQLRVVAVAEPRQLLRERLAAAHGLGVDVCFDDYEALAAAGKLADAVAICTQDRMHLAPVELLAPLGYAILLEKPMSPHLAECEQIIACIRRHGNLFAVCHVLLYTELTTKLREIVRSGTIGEIVSVQHLEPVGWWHQAHSFVRGNWGNQQQSSPMLLSKSCHDIDWLRHIVNAHCTSVASFGSLRHFKASEKQAGAAERCWDCQVEANCPYSAKRIYHSHFERDRVANYINDVITGGLNTLAAVEDALRHGPYGRCVYACDNDVVDHQTVMLEFEGPVSVTFTMTAFTPTLNRSTRIFGTRGYIDTDFVTIKVFDFLTEKETLHDTRIGADAATAAAGHGGGDYFIMQAFVRALATGDSSGIWSGPEATLESHRIVFAAEQARLEKRVVHVRTPNLNSVLSGDRIKQS